MFRQFRREKPRALLNTSAQRRDYGLVVYASVYLRHHLAADALNRAGHEHFYCRQPDEYRGRCEYFHIAQGSSLPRYPMPPENKLEYGKLGLDNFTS